MIGSAERDFLGIRGEEGCRWPMADVFGPSHSCSVREFEDEDEFESVNVIPGGAEAGIGYDAHSSGVGEDARRARTVSSVTGVVGVWRADDGGDGLKFLGTGSGGKSIPPAHAW
jgi:hypothetical protein